MFMLPLDSLRQPSTAKPNSIAYMPQIDALRTLAVCGVAYEHWVPKAYHFGFAWGDAGVQMFFIISGFLISSILLQCRQYSDKIFALKAFYARRFLRIFPLYYLTLLIVFIFQITPIRDRIFWHLTYLSNLCFFLRNDWDGALSHFWSLAVEEQFYLFWPLVVMFIPKKFLSASFFSLVAIGIISRIVFPIIFPDRPLIIILPNLNFDALGLGAILALNQAKPQILRFPISFTSIGLPVFAILFALQIAGVSIPYYYLLSHTFMLLGFVWTIDRASRGFKGIVGRLLNLPVLIYLGRISYGLYLFHNLASWPVSIFCKAIGHPGWENGVSGGMLKIVATLVGATLSWYLFESPINSLKHLFPYRPQTI